VQGMTSKTLAFCKKSLLGGPICILDITHGQSHKEELFGFPLMLRIHMRLFMLMSVFFFTMKALFAGEMDSSEKNTSDAESECASGLTAGQAREFLEQAKKEQWPIRKGMLYGAAVSGFLTGFPGAMPGALLTGLACNKDTQFEPPISEHTQLDVCHAGIALLCVPALAWVLDFTVVPSAIWAYNKYVQWYNNKIEDICNSLATEGNCVLIENDIIELMPIFTKESEIFKYLNLEQVQNMAQIDLNKAKWLVTLEAFSPQVNDNDWVQTYLLSEDKN
jgi:hypothetical protein